MANEVHHTPNHPKWIKAKKMEKEFRLDEKIDRTIAGNECYWPEDIKEFIKIILEINKTAHSRHQKEVLIKKRAGGGLYDA